MASINRRNDCIKKKQFDRTDCAWAPELLRQNYKFVKLSFNVKQRFMAYSKKFSSETSRLRESQYSYS